MADHTITRPRRSWSLHRGGLLWLLCGVTALGAITVGISRVPRDPSVKFITSSTPSTTVVSPAPPLARSLPQVLLVPSLGINIAVGQLGLQANHQVQVPANAHSVGWYRLGPTPGEIGSAVILGHVDSYQGPGIFFNLKSLPVGALIEVRRVDHSTALFRVTSVVQYAKTDFPDALVYGSRRGRILNLVTCGGTFDHRTGSYESNIVVFSRLVGVRPAV